MLTVNKVIVEKTELLKVEKLGKRLDRRDLVVVELQSLQLRQFLNSNNIIEHVVAEVEFYERRELNNARYITNHVVARH